MVRLRTLGWGVTLDYLGEPSVITRVVIRGMQEGQSQRGNVRTEAGSRGWDIARPRAKECRHLWKLEKARNGFSPRTPRKSTAPLTHFTLLTAP